MTTKVIDRLPQEVPGWLIVVFKNTLVRVATRRLIRSVPLILIVSAVSFLLIAIAPGDPARSRVGIESSQQAYLQARHNLGLDHPIYVRYWTWLWHALHGDLGRSLVSNLPVTDIIRERIPVTLSLTLGALIVVSVLGIVLGVVSAVRGGLIGRFIDAVSLVGFAIPSFWLGAVLIGIFAVNLRWLPAIGYVPFAKSPTEWFRSLILPLSALALHSVAVLAKQTRETMMEVLASEHVRMSWANGIPARYVLFRLALKATSIRIVTVIGLQTIALLAGAVFVENVFALPGLGSQLTQSTGYGDITVDQGILLLFTLIVIVVNLAVDLLYSLLDPRVRTS